MTDPTAALPTLSDFAGVVLPESEAGVLGAGLFWAESRTRVVTELDRDDFHDPFHQQVYGALRLAEDANAPCEAQAVVHFLGPAIRQAGGFRRLLDLEGVALCEASLAWHIGELRQASARRRAVAHVMSAAGASGSVDPEEMTRRVSKALEVIDRGLPVTRIGDGLAKTAADIRSDVEHGSEGGGIPTPWWTLNTMSGGMQAGDLTILAARPSVGKSAMGLTWAIGTASAGYWTGFASQEMSEAQCNHRILAQLTGLEARRIKRRQLCPDDLRKIEAAAESASAWPFNLIDKPGLRVRDLYALAKTKCPRGSSMLFVDYLGLMIPEDRRLPTHKAVGSLTKGLKGLARDLGIHVVALSQLHRLDPKRAHGNPEPTMADLRDSGEIEEDADNVILLHRHDYGVASAPGTVQAPSRMTVIVAKQRNDSTGRFDVKYDRTTQRVWEGQ